MILKYVFFFFAIFAIWWELICLNDTQRILDFNSRVKDDSFKVKDQSGTFTAGILLNILYFLWVLVGLVSSQWFLFGVLILISFIPKKNLYMKKVDAFVSLVILVSIVLNAFHFHYDIFNMIIDQCRY